MKFRSHSLLIVLLIMTAFAFAYGYGLINNSLNASGHDRNKKSVLLITESLRLTQAEGIKSLGQLIREQSSIEIPDQAISMVRFSVDPFSDALILPSVPQVQPPDFQWGVLPGQDREIKVAEAPFNAPEALDFSLAKSAGPKGCNFILTVEFYPKNNR
jgi:hypothetical protein